MRGELVALDLETTGLDIETDAIIEIGAVRFSNGEVTAEFTQLINPGFVIPAETTHITGIHQEDLRRAPLLTDVLPTITDFVGDAPVIAHNVGFDIGFMRRFGTLKANIPLDTFELASIMMPRVPRYSLSGLTEILGIDLENAHRALDDARATALLYWHLWERALALPHYILNEINQAMQPFEQWESRHFFRAALEAQNTDETSHQTVLDLFKPFDATQPALDPSDDTRPLDLDAVVGHIAAGGTFDQRIAQYEVRAQQIEMARGVGEALNNERHLLVEAGTGTGKSLAYLVPAIIWAAQNQQRVVISTHTVNLQDQLFHKDLPFVTDTLGVNIKASVMKGRSHYLCPRRLAAVRRRQPVNIDELRTMAKILVWLQDSDAGDKSEITLRSVEYDVWNRLSAQDEGCTTHRCESAMQGACPFYKARKQAEAAHIVIANHALIISDALSENRVLPEYRYLIADEAHQLEDAITSGMSEFINQRMLLMRLEDLGGVTHGLLGDLLHNTRGIVPEKRFLRLEAYVQDVSIVIQEMMAQVTQYFMSVYQFINDSNTSKYTRARIDDRRREHNSFSTIRTSWKALAEYFEVIADAMAQIATAIRKFEQYNIPSLDDHLKSVSAASQALQQMRTTLHRFTQEPDANTVYWLKTADSPRYIAIQSAPLHVGPMMETAIWNKKNTAILTSATLRTAGTFDHIKDRLYADNVPTMGLGSPFNYKEATLLYIPDDMPMPNERNYQKMVERGIVELAAALQGRVLALFTGYSQLRETAANISPRLAMGNITVFDQATGGSQETLLDNFRSTEKAVLLGTRTFWEGVDLPGDDLVALVIVRLPFAVPSDPVFAARSATYNDPFNDFTVPDAILRFRQGFGRLIRTQSDRGIVSVFDSRLIHKSYGLSFLDSLPDCTLQYGPLGSLGKVATDWLNK